jgi:hypothetical protein
MGKRFVFSFLAIEIQKNLMATTYQAENFNAIFDFALGGGPR